MIWGVSFPWVLVAATAVGIGIMFLPISYRNHGGRHRHRGGALIVTVSVISMGEVIRIGRDLNLLLGLIVAVAPWFTTDAPIAYSATCAIAGLAAAALSMPKGPQAESYGK